MDVRIVILAAGKGKRMGGTAPKVLMKAGGVPMLVRLLRAVKESDLDPRPIIVVSPENEAAIRAECGEKYEYVVQRELLGTGHAVQCALPAVGNARAVIVLYGDHPFVRPETILRLHRFHCEKGAPMTMMTVTVPDFEEWRRPFFDFGRVVRNAEGQIINIVELKDASPAERGIKEVNPSFFCFDVRWLADHIDSLKNRNAQGEYYLTDLARIAIERGERIASLDASPLESIGVNTPEQLELVSTL